MKVFIAFVLSCLFAGAFAQVYLEGECPDIKAPSDWNNDGINGLWYSWRATPFAPTQGLRCVFTRYNKTNATNIDIEDGGVNPTNGQINTTGLLPTTILGPGYLRINIAGMVSDYIALGTDYSTYFSLYTCNQVNATHFGEAIFVYTSTRTPSKQTKDAALADIVQSGLDPALLDVSDQQNCPNLE